VLDVVEAVRKIVAAYRKPTNGHSTTTATQDLDLKTTVRV
jgi:hypothetical protein